MQESDVILFFDRILAPAIDAARAAVKHYVVPADDRTADGCFILDGKLMQLADKAPPDAEMHAAFLAATSLWFANKKHNGSNPVEFVAAFCAGACYVESWTLSQGSKSTAALIQLSKANVKRSRKAGSAPKKWKPNAMEEIAYEAAREAKQRGLKDTTAYRHAAGVVLKKTGIEITYDTVKRRLAKRLLADGIIE